MTQAETLVPQIQDLGHRLTEAREMIRGVFIGQERVVDLVLIHYYVAGMGFWWACQGLAKPAWLRRCPQLWDCAAIGCNSPRI